MKCKTVYCCEFCDAPPFEDRNEARKHEAAHFNLTAAEYQLWKQLSVAAEKAGQRVGCASNPDTRRAFDEAIKQLCLFETAHNIPSSARPPQFL